MKKKKIKVKKIRKKSLQRRKKKVRKIRKKSLQRRKSKLIKVKGIVSNIKLKKIKLPNINKQINQFKKFSIIKVLERTFKVFDRAVEEAADLISKPFKSFADYKQKMSRWRVWFGNEI